MNIFAALPPSMPPRAAIELSLGNEARQCLVLALFALLPLLYRETGRRGREALLLWAGILLVSLNPWCADALAARTSAVMAWRWIWAAPITLCLAVSLALFWRRRPADASAGTGAGWGRRRRVPAFAGLGLTALFLALGPWTCRPGNADFHFARPQWKLPQEYAELREIAALLPPESGMKTRTTTEMDGEITVLAPLRQSAWLPVARPGVGVVMLGHMQQGAAARLLPGQGRRRRTIQALVERPGIGKKPPQALDSRRVTRLLRRQGVTHVVVRKNRPDSLNPGLAKVLRRRAQALGETEHFVVYALRPPRMRGQGP